MGETGETLTLLTDAHEREEGSGEQGGSLLRSAPVALSCNPGAMYPFCKISRFRG